MWSTVDLFLLKPSDIITDIKIASLRWAGHVQRMRNDEIVKRIIEGKPEGRRGVGRPCSRWRDAVQEDVKKLNSEGGCDSTWVVVPDMMMMNLRMGVITFLFSGDFRQTLPVVVKDSRADEINASRKQSYIWNDI